ncbi:MAG: GxxExxY protein [Ignavibacteria bacterium]|nr:GxxExxY protein [Ignavibacteria bacterium]
MDEKIIYKEEAYLIIGCCMEAHKILEKGFSEIVYKDALQLEFISHNISFEREKECDINYKEQLLPHKYYADFVVGNKIILEVKAIEVLTDAHIKQTLNYLAALKCKLGLLVKLWKLLPH